MQASCQAAISSVVHWSFSESTMTATKDSGVQPVAVGFQCCSCCGQPGRKITTCSCMKQTGNRHQCLKRIMQEQHQKERSITRKWAYFSVALLQKPEKEEEESEWQVIEQVQPEEVLPEWHYIQQVQQITQKICCSR